MYICIYKYGYIYITTYIVCDFFVRTLFRSHLATCFRVYSLYLDVSKDLMLVDVCGPQAKI